MILGAFKSTAVCLGSYLWYRFPIIAGFNVVGKRPFD